MMWTLLHILRITAVGISISFNFVNTSFDVLALLQNSHVHVV